MNKKRNQNKRKKKMQTAILVAMRLVFFVLFPAVFATAFSGIKYIFSQLGSGKGLEGNAFLLTLVAVSAFTILFGRFFCGFACAFGSYGDFVYWISSTIQKKRKKKPLHIPEMVSNRLRYCKYVVLLAIVLLCTMGNAAWVSEKSPWTVFSRIQAGHLPVMGVGVLVLLLLSIGMLFDSRFFCRFFCPLGAIFSILPILPSATVQRNRENCIKGCAACKRSCPANLEIADTKNGEISNMGECFSCGKCMEICPKGNTGVFFIKEKKQILPWHLVRGILLGMVLYIITR